MTKEELAQLRDLANKLLSEGKLKEIHPKYQRTTKAGPETDAELERLAAENQLVDGSESESEPEKPDNGHNYEVSIMENLKEPVKPEEIVDPILKMAWQMQPNAVTFAKYIGGEVAENIMTLITEQLMDCIRDGREMPRDKFLLPYVTISCDDAVPKRNKTYVIKEALKMTDMKFSFKWKEKDPNTGKDRAYSTGGYVISTIHDVVGTNRIVLNFNPWVIPILLTKQHGVTWYQRSIALELKGKYSKRLYKFLCSKRSEGQWFYPMDQFRKDFHIPDSMKVNGIRLRILEPSQKEMNEVADFTFQYALHKEVKAKGKKRAYDGIQFWITRKDATAASLPSEQDGLEYHFVHSRIWAAACIDNNGLAKDLADIVLRAGKIKWMVSKIQWLDKQFAAKKIDSTQRDWSIIKILREDFGVDTKKLRLHPHNVKLKEELSKEDLEKMQDRLVQVYNDSGSID